VTIAATTSALARKNSGTRFAVWFSALLAIAALFFIGKPFAHGAATRIGLPEIVLPAHWAQYVLFGWAAIAIYGLARVVHGLWKIHALRASCIPIDTNLLPLPSTQRQFTICSSESVRVPAAIGFFRPLIVLPTWTLKELSPEELSAVVLHELAHVERWDDWTNLAQKVIRALLFFHPAVWWIDSRIAIEREMSCDDAVLVKSQNPHKYAACLVSLAEKTSRHHSLSLAQAAVNRVKHTAQRISKILDGRPRKATLLLRPLAAALAAFGVVGFVMMRQMPQLVSFDRIPLAAAQSNSSVDSGISPTPGVRAFAASLQADAIRRRPKTVHAKRATEPIHEAPEIAQRNWKQPDKAPEQTQATERSGHAVVVNAAMSDVAAPPFMYVFVQTEQYDEFGNITVITSVWRIPVGKRLPAQIHNGAPIPHST
jgi:hypothetical protein